MAVLYGNYGSQQTRNGVVELLSPLGMVWRRAIEWGGTAALGSDGISVTITSTNLPKEGQVVRIDESGKAKAITGNLTITDSGTTSLALVWTGYEVADSAAVDTITVIDGSQFLFEISSDRVNTTTSITSGQLVYWDGAAGNFYGSSASGITESTKYAYLVGVCEGMAARSGYYRIRWNRTPQIRVVI